MKVCIELLAVSLFYNKKRYHYISNPPMSAIAWFACPHRYNSLCTLCICLNIIIYMYILIHIYVLYIMVNLLSR